jgi:hypothetical protein
MGCIRSRLKIWVECVRCATVVFCLGFAANAWAIFASQFSLLGGEQYSDNIFFSKSKEHDFITIFTPTLTLLYAPEGQTSPTLNFNISSSGQIYARHSDLNNFGDNTSVNGGYSYQYSPRLNFHLFDTFQRQGPTRTGGLSGFDPLPTGPTSPPPPGGIGSPSSSQNLKDLISRGDQLSNFVSFQGSYRYRPDISFTGGYSNSFVKFITAGGTDVFHTINARGIYNWRNDHNLHAGYSISVNNSRNGDSGLIHNFDVGDDYFSNYNLQLTPTLSLAASTGLSLNTGSGGVRVANNTSVTVTKLWETGELNGGIRKGLTPSFGVSGISDTTSLFTNLKFRLTEKLTTSLNANYSFFDTEDVNFKTFQAGLGMQYLITSWVSSGLSYYFNWLNSGAGATSTDLLNKGVVRSNSVFLHITMHFDLWPNTGLARSMTSPTLTPVLRTPFPNITAPQSSPTPLTPP